MSNNIYLTTVYHLERDTEEYTQNQAEMCKLHLSSVRKRLKKLDKIIVLRGDAKDTMELFEEIFHRTYNLWKKGGNILFCDLDTLFIRDVNIFGRFKKFWMFNKTCEPLGSAGYGGVFKYVFNCGVRYFPTEMSDKTWMVGIDLWGNPEPIKNKIWDYEQYIYNRMLYAQDEDYKKYIIEEYNYQSEAEGYHGTESISLKDACILHLYGSRDTKKKGEWTSLGKMRKFNKQFN